MESHLLPKYPKVMVDGIAIVIHYENGEKEVWGYEPNNKIAEEVAKDIELGLQAIHFVSQELLKALSKISEQLEVFGVPTEYAGDYICQGYRKVSKWFYELDP